MNVSQNFLLADEALRSDVDVLLDITGQMAGNQNAVEVNDKAAVRPKAQTPAFPQQSQARAVAGGLSAKIQSSGPKRMMLQALNSGLNSSNAHSGISSPRQLPVLEQANFAAYGHEQPHEHQNLQLGRPEENELASKDAHAVYGEEAIDVIHEDSQDDEAVNEELRTAPQEPSMRFASGSVRHFDRGTSAGDAQNEEQLSEGAHFRSGDEVMLKETLKESVNSLRTSEYAPEDRADEVHAGPAAQLKEVHESGVHQHVPA